MSSLKADEIKAKRVVALWKFIGTIVLGILFGYLMFRMRMKDGETNFWYWIITSLIFLVIALVLFFIRLIKLKKLEKQE